MSLAEIVVKTLLSAEDEDDEEEEDEEGELPDVLELQLLKPLGFPTGIAASDVGRVIQDGIRHVAENDSRMTGRLQGLPPTE